MRIQAGVSPAGSQLLDRDGELARIDTLCAAAASGSPGLLLIDGEAGIGKSTLLEVVVAKARGEHGLTALSARGGEFERDVPYGMVRQLFERIVHDRDGDMLSGAASIAAPVFGLSGPSRGVGPDVRLAVRHGLYWLTANLADEAPLLLAIDDAQWADAPSLRWLLFLVRRLEGVSALVVVTVRPGDCGAPDELLDALRAEPISSQLSLPPLTVQAAHTLAREIVGESADTAFSQTCHEASRGNPFLLIELLRAAEAAGLRPTRSELNRLRRLGPKAVGRSVLRRLRRLSPGAVRVAEAVAVLEPHAELAGVAGLARLTLDETAEAAVALVAARVLRDALPLEFAHPVVRAALYRGLPEPRRAAAHRRAAEVLHASGAPVAAVAVHLSQSPPTADPAAVVTLRHAAEEALARGDPATAVNHLTRALAEPPSAADRGDVLRELGVAEGLDQRPAAIGHLREALAFATAPEQLAAAALALGHALSYAGEIDAAYEVARNALERLPGDDAPATLELEELRLGSAVLAGRAKETVAHVTALTRRLSPESSATCAILGHAAMQTLLSGAPRQVVRRSAERAVCADGRMFARTEQFGRETAGLVLLWIDERERAEAIFTEALAAARATGLPRSVAYFAAVRAFALQRGGELARSEAALEEAVAASKGGELARPGAAAETALSTREDEGLALWQLIAVIVKTLLLVEQGQPRAAERLAATTSVPPDAARSPAFALLRHAQGTAQFAFGRVEEAARTYAGVGEVFARTGVRTPAIVAWRADLALALGSCGRREEALGYANEELELAERCDLHRARGAALRAVGLLEGGEQGLSRLREAAAAFKLASAPVEQARTFIDLGAALRRAKRRKESREPLGLGLDLARQHRATALEERARVELAATGARSRPVERSGLESLTPSELRVAEMARDGMTNREVAQALFVGLKTVEVHLTRVYQKLGIRGRPELAGALGANVRAAGPPLGVDGAADGS